MNITYPFIFYFRRFLFSITRSVATLFYILVLVKEYKHIDINVNPLLRTVKDD